MDLVSYELCQLSHEISYHLRYLKNETVNRLGDFPWGKELCDEEDA